MSEASLLASFDLLYGLISLCLDIIIARNALGARAPQGGEINRGPNLQGEVVSALRKQRLHPRGRARVHFFKEIGEVWTVGEVI